MNENTNPFSVARPDPKSEENREWIMKEKAIMMNYCKNKDLGADKILNEQTAVLLPQFIVWAVENRLENKKYWVITGDLLSDHLAFDVAPSARDALRHFTMSWQLKAEKLERRLAKNEIITGTADQQKDTIDLLRDQAEKFYAVSMQDELW